MMARFKSSDDLPLRKTLNIPVCIVKSVSQKDNNYYLQVLIYECLYKHEG